MSGASQVARASGRVAAPPAPLLSRVPFGLRVLATRLIILLLILGYWQFGTSPRMQFWSSTPLAIVSTLVDWVVDGTIWGHLAATLEAMSLGYLVGCVTGIAAGLVLGFSPRTNRVFSPFLTALYALPKIALAPLFIILFGIGIESKVVLVGFTVFFLLLNSTRDGVNDVDQDLILSLRLMGSARSETTRLVVLPATLPWIFTGMRIAIRYAFTNTLLAELIGSNHGIGYLIEDSSGNFDSTGAYAAILVLVILSVGITEILTVIERRMAHRGQ